MMNKLILQYLSEYIANPDPQYAVMLKGKWGCGKTHFVKDWLKTFGHKCPNEDFITLEPIYISAYGMTTIADMKVALDREINPFFYSSTGKFIKNTAKILGRIAFKTSFDLDGNGKDETSFSASLDSFALFKSESENIQGTKLLVFDDIERCEINMKQLLGFINGFVEHCSCHVVVIGDESRLDAECKTVFDDFKEKTIGREFEIQPDTEAAIDYFLSEVPTSSYLQSQRDFIIQCFKTAGYNNLRVLRQCLYDFKSQLFQVGVECENDNLFLHNILGSFIATYFEYVDKENKPLVTNWADSYQEAQYGKNSELKNKLVAIQSKYKPVNVGCIYQVMCPEYVTRIVNHITKGVPMVQYFKERIENRPKELMPWEKLYSFYELAQSQFDEAYDLSMDAAIAGNKINNYQFGVTMSYFSYFHVEGIRYLIMAHMSLLKKRLREMIQAVNTLKDLYQLRGSFIQGCNYVVYDHTDDDPLKNIIAFFYDEFNKKAHILPDEMQKALRSLSDDNVGSLVSIDGLPYPDKSSTYELRAIFAKEDANKLFAAIKVMSNRGRNEFSSFLAYHYKFNCQMVDGQSRYADDLSTLRQLKELVDKEVKNNKSIDRHVFSVLSTNLNKAIKRADGAHLV